MLGMDRRNKMALTKETTQDKIEVVGTFKSIQVRTKIAVLEDGVELSASFNRHMLQCVYSVRNDDDSWTHTDTDVSGESTEVQAIANAVWTDSVKAARKTENETSII
jgi:hypothetical protein